MSSYYDKVVQAEQAFAAGATCRQIAGELGWAVPTVRSALSRLRSGKIRPPVQQGWAHRDKLDLALIEHWEHENSHQLKARLSAIAGQEITQRALNARANRLGLVKPGSPIDWQTKRMGRTA